MVEDLERLKTEDVRQAVQDPDPEKRSHATMRLAKVIVEPDLSEADRDYANRLISVISEDVSELVRRSLAITLRNSPFLPKPVLSRLLEDIDSIAVPLITHSPLLTDEDLMQVLKSGMAGKVRAVAARKNLSNRIILSLIDTGDCVSARQIAANDSLTLTDEAAEAMIETYREDDFIRQAMLNRASMPMPVVEKLVATSAEDIAKRLQGRANLSEKESQLIGRETHERTLVQLTNDHFSEKTLQNLVFSLKENGRLTPELTLRAMGLGKVSLVHYCLASLAELSVRKVVLMLHDTGPFALRGLCAKAGFKDSQTRFMGEALKLYSDIEMSGGKLTANEFQTKMIERLLTLPFELPEEESDYFLAILDGLESPSRKSA
jgi:uncharacterized protein (DUF2336 family)